MKTDKDLDLLRFLADFRLATVPLLAARLGISEQMIRRRCRKLAADGLLRAIPRNPGQGRGRPEWVYSLTSEGVGLGPLTAAKWLPAEVPAGRVTAESVERIAEHLILLNWLAVGFAAIPALGNHFAVRFISSTSPFHLSNGGGTILAARFCVAKWNFLSAKVESCCSEGESPSGPAESRRSLERKN